ncbi:MAG TPA: 2-oxoglutarate and iron-dependent oxygenase domain-containing protein, partial [Mycobacterium sp.]|nr:2-oxoglutarate and iron-dependent oxygenase domain-containing protein [Mycobacterium sp.]
MLPVLDLTDADRDAASFRARLREAAHGSGFFYLVGHGVAQAQIDEILALARRFFAEPVEVKNEISHLKSPQFRGYARLGGELTNGTVDWREQIDIGPERPTIEGAEGYWRLQGPNLWPASPPGFRAAFENW